MFRGYRISFEELPQSEFNDDNDEIYFTNYYLDAYTLNGTTGAGYGLNDEQVAAIYKQAYTLDSDKSLVSNGYNYNEFYYRYTKTIHIYAIYRVVHYNINYYWTENNAVYNYSDDFSAHGTNVAGTELHTATKVDGREGALCEFSLQAGACRWAPPRIRCQELMGAPPFQVCLLLRPGSHPGFLPVPTPTLLCPVCLVNTI